MYAPPVQTQAPKATGTGFGVTALVTGIVGTFLCWIPVFGLPLLAVVFGSVGLTKTIRGSWNSGKGLDIAGLCLGIVGALFAVLITVGVFAAAASYPTTV
jgi:hypothetical protein